MTGPAALALWLGTALVLSTVAPVRRPSLERRLRPHLAGAEGTDPGSPHPLATLGLLAGERLARLHATAEPLDRRLRRVHHPSDPASFRLRQLSHAVVALGVTGAVLALAPVALPSGLVVVLLLAAPVLAVLAHEQALAERERRQRRLLDRELPVVAEHLAMLLGAGRSLTTAVADLGARGHGPCSDDLRRVSSRIRHGLGEAQALREWADLRRSPGVSRLVGVLALAGEAADLDRLVDQEAAALRADAHRDLVATLERRAQQVWVPVTVATLLPGSLLLLVPFLDALRLFAGP